MTTYPLWAAGQRVTAALLTAAQPVFITGGTGTNATTTLADAPGYAIDAVANASYAGYMLSSYSASAVTTDIKYGWTGPAGFAITRSMMAPALAVSANDDTTVLMLRRSATAQAMGAPTGALSTIYREDFLITTGAAAGTVQLQYAANAAGTATLNSGFIFVWRTA